MEFTYSAVDGNGRVCLNITEFKSVLLYNYRKLFPYSSLYLYLRFSEGQRVEGENKKILTCFPVSRSSFPVTNKTEIRM